MAYISQERKKEIAAKIKPLLLKYKLKGSLSIDNYTTLNLNIKSGKLDFITNYYEDYTPEFGRFDEAGNLIKSDNLTFSRHDAFRKTLTGNCNQFLKEAFEILNSGNHDNSDSQTDYFDVGWYSYLKVGKWNKPYILEA